MPSFTYNDSEARKPFEEPGDYMVTVEDFKFEFARGSGNEILALQLRTPGGCLVFDNLVFTEKAWWKIDHALKCFLPSKGFTPPGKGENVEIDNDWVTEHLLGATGMVTLNKGQSTSGKTRNEVAAYNAPKAGQRHTQPPKPESTTSVAQRAAKEADRAAAAPASGGAAPGSTAREKAKAPARAAGAAPQQPDDDDIPF
jgi:hypothetical protein